MSTQVEQRPATRGSDRRGGGLRRTLQYGVLGVLTLLFVSPLIYMISTAFKSTSDAASPDPQWVPENPTFNAFRTILA